MTFEEEVARTLAEWRSGEHAEPWEVDMYMDAAAAVMPLVKRAQAEALRDAHADIQAYTDSGAPFGHRPVEEFLLQRADRIENEGAGA